MVDGDLSPVGEMGNGVGKIDLWEKTSVSKGPDIFAEYVGCWEDTGFMAYDKTDIIHSQTVI